MYKKWQLDETGDKRSVYFVTALKIDLLCCKCIVRLKIAHTICILNMGFS